MIQFYPRGECLGRQVEYLNFADVFSNIFELKILRANIDDWD
jgi:hypothetical protein